MWAYSGHVAKIPFIFEAALAVMTSETGYWKTLDPVNVLVGCPYKPQCISEPLKS
jgi:hypothetical protein